MKIKELCKDERPCEKLLSRGSASLGTGELLSVLIRTGTSEESALELSQRLLASAGSLKAISEMSADALCSVRGIGPFKAAAIMAAFELGRRFFQERPDMNRSPVNSARMIFDIMHPYLKGLSHEECWVLLFNRSLYCIDKVKLTVGGVSSTAIDMSMIARMVLEKKDVTEVVLVHNHPSQNPRPGTEDVARTEQLRNALSHFDIGLMDHVVVCDDCYFSFADDAVSYV